MATEDAVADAVDAAAIVGGLGVNGTVAHARDGGQQFKGRSGWVGKLKGAIEPGATLIDCVESILGNEGAELVLVIGGVARKSEDFSGVDIQGNSGTGAVTECNFRGALEVNINTEVKGLPLLGGIVLV